MKDQYRITATKWNLMLLVGRPLAFRRLLSTFSWIPL
jgi:hypothetical protein